MTSFIKPSPHHWKPSDFELSQIELVPSLLHITKTICLLESRCDDYAAYLHAIVRNREASWTEAIDRWNFEECQHGVMLRTLCESADAQFAFPDCMSTYESLVSYHEPTGKSVRGSLGAELVSRCVVEALASTLYRVLADSTDDPRIQSIYSALAQDEARHYGMFLKMLHTEAAATGKLGIGSRILHAVRRLLELEDAQIMVASCVVAGRSEGMIHRRREANWYLVQLYDLYRWKHLRYAIPMLLRTVSLPTPRFLVTSGATMLYLAVKFRLALAVAYSYLFPPAPAMAIAPANRAAVELP